MYATTETENRDYHFHLVWKVKTTPADTRITCAPIKIRIDDINLKVYNKIDDVSMYMPKLPTIAPANAWGTVVYWDGNIGLYADNQNLAKLEEEFDVLFHPVYGSTTLPIHKTPHTVCRYIDNRASYLTFTLRYITGEPVDVMSITDINWEFHLKFRIHK